jgi:phosphoenolpyruvate carboxykinase (ATP)
MQMVTPDDLLKYGIKDISEIIYNPSYDLLFDEETKSGLEKPEKGIITKNGAVAIDTGVFTGRSPKDKYIVSDDITRNTIWWRSEMAKGSDNKPITMDIWNHCYPAKNCMLLTVTAEPTKTQGSVSDLLLK